MLAVIIYLAKTDRIRTCQKIWPIVKNDNFDSFWIYANFYFKRDSTKISISDVYVEFDIRHNKSKLS